MLFPVDVGEVTADAAIPATASESSVQPAAITTISLDEKLFELERSLLIWALTASRGNKSRAAKLLRVKRSTLGDRIRHCGLESSTFV